jgi:hypothetical protein
LRVTDLVQLAYREYKQQFGKEVHLGAVIASKLMVKKGIKG